MGPRVLAVASEVGSGKALLIRALGATLNGALDARAAWQGESEWLDVVLSALQDARDGSKDGNEFLIGLIQFAWQMFIYEVGYAEQFFKTCSFSAPAPSRSAGGYAFFVGSPVIRNVTQMPSGDNGYSSSQALHWSTFSRGTSES